MGVHTKMDTVEAEIGKAIGRDQTNTFCAVAFSSVGRAYAYKEDYGHASGNVVQTAKSNQFA